MVNVLIYYEMRNLFDIALNFGYTEETVVILKWKVFFLHLWVATAKWFDLWRHSNVLKAYFRQQLEYLFHLCHLWNFGCSSRYVEFFSSSFVTALILQSRSNLQTIDRSKQGIFILSICTLETSTAIHTGRCLKNLRVCCSKFSHNSDM